MKTPAGLYTGSTRYYLIGVLVALELLMSFSFLGYIHIEPISVTFAYIPVLLAALLGVPEAAALGFVFGVASMWKAGAHYVAPVDQLFSPFMSGAPVESILLSVGTRTLFGVIVGVLCLAIKRTRHLNIGIALISFFGAEIHSILVYGAMGLLFPKTGYTAATAFRSFFTLQDIVSNLVTMGLVLLTVRVEQSRAWQQFRRRVEKVQSLHRGDHYHRRSLLIMILITVCFAAVVAIYFVNRMEFVLGQSGLILSDNVYFDLIHLQVQFLIGILSMMTLVIIFLIFNRKYTTYTHMEARQDVLTGVFTRRFFFRMCEQALKQHVFTSNAHGYGAVPIGGKKTVQEYYQSADQVLYQAKKQGRDQYIIRATTE